MDLSRRQFFQASATALATTAFGFDLSRAQVRARELKIARTTQTMSVCPYCAVGCSVVIHTLGDRAQNVEPTVVHIEGDTESLEIPEQFLEPGTEYKIEILVYAENGNRTIAESTFVTEEEDS